MLRNGTNTNVRASIIIRATGAIKHYRRISILFSTGSVNGNVYNITQKEYRGNGIYLISYYGSEKRRICKDSNEQFA